MSKDRFELPAQGFSILRSTAELLRHLFFFAFNTLKEAFHQKYLKYLML